MKKFLISLLCLALCLACAAAAFAESAEKPAAGDIYVFGRYEQDNDESNGPEPVEWIVLESEEDKLFVISRYCLEVARFYDERVTMWWGISPLREWMNNDFLTTLFNEEEQARVLTTTVQNTNPHGLRGAGADTEDRIYLLSRKECEKYFPTQDSRVAWPTEHAKSQGCTLNKKTGSTRWWLRTPGARTMDVQGVRIDGRFTSYGMQDVDWPTNCLRPCMWISWAE